MMELEYSFGRMPWEEELEKLAPGSTVSALTVLTLLEQESEQTVQEALELLDEKSVTLDIQQLTAPAGGAAALRLKQEASFRTQGLDLKLLDPNDPLRLYIEELAATPAAGDPQLLAEWFLAGEQEVGENLTALCLSHVVEEAISMTGRGVLLLDLIQEGSMGLWQSIMSFSGGDFEKHSRWWIRQYMAKAVLLQARASGVGQKLRQDLQDYMDTDQRLLTELGRNPTTAEIAQCMRLTEEEAENIEKMLLNARALERAKAGQQEPEPTPEDEQAVEDTAYFQSRQRIMELLSGLEEEDARLLSLRFGLEGGLPLTVQQTANVLNLTADQVVSREAAALAKLRNQ